MTLDANEFIRRFLLHVLPDKFVKIRHYGLLGSRKRKANIGLCRKLLGVDDPQNNDNARSETWQELMLRVLLRVSGIDVTNALSVRKAGCMRPGYFSLRTGMVSGLET